MPAISVGSVEVDVVPNTTGIYARLKEALEAAGAKAGKDAGEAAGKAFGPAMQSEIGSIGTTIGEQIGAQIANRIKDAVKDALKTGITLGGQQARPAAAKQGEQSGGAFARSLRAKLQEAFRSMPKLDVKLGDTGVDADLARLRAKLETLSNKTVGVDIDAATARAQAADIEERLRRIGAAHPNVAVRADTARAIAQLQALQAQIDEVSADPLRIRMETDGQLGTRLRAAVAQAEASLPNINIGADTSPAEVEIARLRAQLTSLRDARVGIDIDAGDALARITEIQTRLARLSSQNADVNVRVDAGAAAAQLAAFQAAVNRLDGQTARVDVDTTSAVSGMQVLITTAIAFGPAIIPALPVVAAGLGAVAAAGVAAAAGIGSIALVAVPAFKGIGSALTAQKAAQDAATNATYKGGQASSQGASKALQLAGAQQSLATAQRNAARQISDAERGVSDASRAAAKANAQAAAQVKQARVSLADAYAAAADRMQQANQAVNRAERDLAQAQKSSRQAQLDLTAARAEASRQLQDLNNQLKDSQLSERDAEIALKEATAARNAVMNNPNASDLDRQKALLAYDQAVQRLNEQRVETKRLQADTTKANKAGVEGSQTVKSAQEQLASAQQAVIDKTSALKDAQADVAKTQIENTRSIADAQAKLSEAQKNVSEAQRQGAENIARAQERVVQAQQSGADSIASAQRQIQSASMSAAGGIDQAAIAQAKYQAELAKLTPAARGTLNAFVALRSAFGDWSKSLQPQVMPIFTRALVSLRNTLPTLTPFVRGAVTAITELQDRASRSVKSPFWQGFKKDLQGNVTPAIVGLGVAIGHLIKGMAGIIDAFLPHMDGISSRMQKITKRFADWGAGLKGSPEFERFLTFASDKAPLLGDALRKIGRAFLQVGEALSPLSGPLLQLLGGIANAIAIVADKAPWFILLIYGIVVAMRLWTIAQWAFNAAAAANPYTLIVIGILALIAAVVYAYNRFGWFRAGVQAVWDWLKTASLYLWNTVLKPVFTAIGNVVVWLWTYIIKPYIGFIIAYFKGVASVAMWIWTNAIQPAFNFIAAAAKILFTALVVIVLLPIIATFKILAATGMWLWNNAIKPAFHGIATVALWLWKNVFQPTFQEIGDKAKWLWSNAIKPAWDGIKSGAKIMWENVLRPLFNAFVLGLKTVGKWGTWLWKNALKPAWDGIVLVSKYAWDKGIKPVFNGIKTAVGKVADAFKMAKDAIKLAWDKLKGIARGPVEFIVNTVYGKGIRPTWNAVAKAFGAPPLPAVKFASGGIMPGYTPGKDVHKFVSPTGGALELSGGEAIMRPEFTRAVGSGFINTLNSIASTRGATGVKSALAPVFGGSAPMSTDMSSRYATGGIVQKFADGGIFGWIKSAGSALKGAGSDAWNNIKKGASWLTDSLESSARAGVKNVVNPLLSKFPGMDTGFGKLIRKIPDKIIDALFGYSKKADSKGAGGIGGPRIAAGLKWAKTQAGLPYQWAGNGNPSWDCSGFMSAIESVIRGQKPHRRWATGAFSGKTAPPGWVYHGNSPFKIGITNAGVGHTAGTIAKTNVESRGGAGVVVGSRARGYNDRLFGSWYGFKPGTYDAGGYIPPGLNLVNNGTGKPEPVFTTVQANALTSMAARGTQQPAGLQPGDALTLVVDGQQFHGYVDTRANGVVGDHFSVLTQTLNAS
ncbi:hypothetical protein ACFYNA_15130 [Streptomyces sp. NPDC006640]|uniref:hypothetical protein n=1 Tax=Streptomyces sp. NPDC006640 TaxID=3364754 RepID=UPI00369D7A52